MSEVPSLWSRSPIAQFLYAFLVLGKQDKHPAPLHDDGAWCSSQTNVESEGVTSKSQNIKLDSIALLEFVLTNKHPWQTRCFLMAVVANGCICSEPGLRVDRWHMWTERIVTVCSNGCWWAGFVKNCGCWAQSLNLIEGFGNAGVLSELGCVWCSQPASLLGILSRKRLNSLL